MLLLSAVATKAHSLECVRSLVQNAADINRQQYCGTSALHQAASEGLVDIMRHLVEHGASLHVMEEYHISPVFSAAQYGQTACLKILLDRDTSTCDITGMNSVTSVTKEASR